MSEQRTCDRCGKSPATVVIAAATLTDVVAPDTQTGHSEQADACASHQEDVLAALHAYCVETLRDQVPLHREIAKRAGDRDDAAREVAKLAPELLEYDGREDKMPKALATKRDGLLAKATAAEEARVEVLERANAASEKRKATLPHALKGRT